MFNIFPCKILIIIKKNNIYFFLFFNAYQFFYTVWNQPIIRVQEKYIIPTANFQSCISCS